jgi:putative hemolysin
MADPRLPAILGIIALVTLAGLFAASEAALLGLSRLRLLRFNEDPVNRSLAKLLDERGRYLTTILVGNTIVMLAADSLATWLAIVYGVWQPVLVATVIMALAVTLLAEIFPKMVVVQDPLKWASRLTGFLRFMGAVLKPITWVLVGVISFFIRLFGGDPSAQGPYVTEEDIRALVNVGEKHGALEEEEKEMIHSVFEFGDTLAREVMTPRTDIVAADVEDTVSAAVDLVNREGYSKILIFEGNRDRIVGVVHAREMLGSVARGELSRPLRTLMRPVKVIPENKKVQELLREMQAEKVSVAIVVDEYGGTAGLITMEDLLEEIVGEIMDEFDAEEQDRPPVIKRLGDGEVVVDARMKIDDVNEQLGLHLPTEDFESIGGYAFGKFGRVPVPGEQVAIGNGLTLVVEETAGRRLRSVRIKNVPVENGAEFSVPYGEQQPVHQAKI